VNSSGASIGAVVVGKTRRMMHCSWRGGSLVQAMVLEQYERELVLQRVEDPRPGPTEIVLRVRAAGMCYTDIKIITGQLASFIRLPHIPGHEIAGEVVEVGSEVRDVRIGDRGVAYCLVTCGVCEMCRTGRENLCFATRRLGFELPGGFAERVKLPAVNLCPFESPLPFEHMAILPDAVATPFHALVKLAGLRMGQSALIVGAGGLGVHAVQIAVALGAAVAVADISKEALALAGSFGAEMLINPREVDPREMASDFTQGRGFDLVLEGVGRQESMQWSLKTLKKGGKCIVMGYDPVNPVPIPLVDMHNYEWTVAGTKVSTRLELQEVIRLVERKQIRPVVSETISLADANRGLKAIRNGAVCGRTVIRIDDE
jgi:2-desacetyl-2-hydroxyethyl bacteriochlorophyllide A dehydrogenase